MTTSIYDAQRTAMTTGKKERVGIVGVGRMGLAMLKHLVKHGYQVTACDIDDKQLAMARDAGVAILDAPICRGRFAADEGTLLALVGGTPDVVERGRAVYGCFCSDYAHLGEVGHGQVGKTMNNLLLWINAVGLLEAGRLLKNTGINLGKLRAALLIS